MSSPSINSIVNPQYRAILPWSYSRASAASLLAHLPPRPVTDYMIAVYFNTVYWLMVVLHEGPFSYHYHTIMDLYARDRKLVPNTNEDYTFAVLLLMVVALGVDIHLSTQPEPGGVNRFTWILCTLRSTPVLNPSMPRNINSWSSTL
jgi:hypothetical protein